MSDWAVASAGLVRSAARKDCAKASRSDASGVDGAHRMARGDSAAVGSAVLDTGGHTRTRLTRTGHERCAAAGGSGNGALGIDPRTSHAAPHATKNATNEQNVAIRRAVACVAAVGWGKWVQE